MPKKRRVVSQVSRTKTARFNTQPEEPLKSASHHPTWCLAHPTGMKVERGTNANHHSCVELAMKLRHEEILFGSAETNPNEVRLDIIDHRNEIVFFKIGKRAPWWTIGPNNLEPGESLLHSCREVICDTLRPAKKEIRETQGGGLTEKAQHQIGPIHPIHGAKPTKSSNPGQGHAIRNANRRILIGVSDVSTTKSLHDAVNVGYADVTTRIPGIQPLDDDATRDLEIDSSHFGAENVYLRYIQSLSPTRRRATPSVTITDPLMISHRCWSDAWAWYRRPTIADV